MNTKTSPLINLIKGSLAPQDFELSGNLTPAHSNKMIDAIKDNSQFLKKVEMVKMSKLETEVDAHDIAEGILVRVEEGKEPTEEQLSGIDNIGCKLQALPVQLFANVKKSTIENNAFNPNFDQDTFNKFMRRFSNELVYLGFAGESAEGISFKTLNHGWLDIIRTDGKTNKASYTDGATISDRLTALVRQIHEDVIGEASIIINPKDYQEYLLEIAKDTATASILLNATAKSFLGYPIEVQNKMPQGSYLATPLKNLAFGMCMDIFRSREWNNRKRVVEYTFDVSCDYEVIVKKWATICEQAIDLILSSLDVSTTVGSTQSVTVSSLNGDITATSNDETTATVTYTNASIEITGVASGVTTVTVTDGTNTKVINVTVS